MPKLRYLLALLAAYGAFFLLVRLWLLLHGRRLALRRLPDIADAAFDFGLPRPGGFRGGGGQFGGGGASARIDGGQRLSRSIAAEPERATRGGIDLPDADDILLPLLLLASLVAALLAFLNSL